MTLAPDQDDPFRMRGQFRLHQSRPQEMESTRLCTHSVTKNLFEGFVSVVTNRKTTIMTSSSDSGSLLQVGLPLCAVHPSWTSISVTIENLKQHQWKHMIMETYHAVQCSARRLATAVPAVAAVSKLRGPVKAPTVQLGRPL